MVAADKTKIDAITINYKKGSTVAAHQLLVIGYCTTGKTQWKGIIPFPHFMGNNVTGMEITSGNVTIRQNGEYVYNDVNILNTFNVTVTKRPEGFSVLFIPKKGAPTGGMNNDVCGFVFHSIVYRLT